MQPVAIRRSANSAVISQIAVWFGDPGERAIAGPDGERVAEQVVRQQGQRRRSRAEQRDPHDRRHRGGGVLGLSHHPGETPGAEPGSQADHRGAEEVDAAEPGTGGRQAQQRPGAEQGDVGEVAGGSGDQRGDQAVSGDVVLVRRLECEQHARGRRLEDRRDPTGRAGDEQRLGLVHTQEAAKAVLHRGAEGCTQVDRRALEAHRTARAQGRDAGHDPTDHRPLGQRVGAVVEVLDVRVGGGGVGPSGDPSERERGDGESDDGRRGLDRQGRREQALEHDAGGELVECSDQQSGAGPDDDGRDDQCLTATIHVQGSQGGHVSRP